jgi:hypothetical protein
MARNNLLVVQTSLSALAIGCTGLAIAPNIATLILGKDDYLLVKALLTDISAQPFRHRIWSSSASVDRCIHIHRRVTGDRAIIHTNVYYQCFLLHDWGAWRPDDLVSWS